jgi:alpha-L-fucosidase 2
MGTMRTLFKSLKSDMPVLLVLISLLSCGTKSTLLLQPPEHGFVSSLQATKWEESLLTGNGTIGAMVTGDPLNERIILSHERLFMPENPVTKAPDLGGHMEEIGELVMKGDGFEASALTLELGREVGIEKMVWTDPLIPACQIEILGPELEVTDYARSVNYETGEAITAWQTVEGTLIRKIFTSRPDNTIVMDVSSPNRAPVNMKMRLAQLPLDGGEEFSTDDLIEEVSSTVSEDGTMKYMTRFMKKWDGSLKGYVVESVVSAISGSIQSEHGWLKVENAKEVTVLTKIRLSYELPLVQETGVDSLKGKNYESLLKKHEAIQGEMFNRFSLELGGEAQESLSPEALLESSSFGNLNTELVEQLCEAARYTLISSTGELPPSLQGIWGGTWRPAWSGDFTLNGNVPSAIASGLNTSFREVTKAYLDYMYSMMDDFSDNAIDLYGAPGIFVPSRCSSGGKTYHYTDWHPHLFWFAGGAWTSQFFYDYWQYTGDELFLKDRAIPFMMASLAFYEYIISRDEHGKLMFLPSYSPEVGPLGHHPLAINATMDIAALKQLLRNLIRLSDEAYLDKAAAAEWKTILADLPEYAIDETGDLKEWIWPNFTNKNEHRHASHLYPLFYEVDPDFLGRSELIDAAQTAIENRLAYRRDKQGAEMAFGLVQIGLAAAHIGDVEHAYECVDWLCNSYWSPAFTSYHDPGEIFNVDICGGLPALITEMIVQSSSKDIVLLPALPEQWPNGEIKGVGTRCGATIDLKWKQGSPVAANLRASRDASIVLSFSGEQWQVDLKEGEVYEWKNQL